MPFSFKNRVAIVTGGSGGIGSATAMAFVQAGAKVIIVDRQPTEKEVPNSRFVQADVTDFEQVGTCVKEILAAEKAIHFLVNNAGISRDAPVWRLTEANWDQVLAVNLKGAFNFIHHLAPYFRQHNFGKIVNVSSINGLRGKFGLANYSASKAGLIGLTKTVARELGRHQINVNAVAPGYILTPLTEKLPQKFIDAAQAETALDRLGTPEDVAHTILFLCSEWAQHITGHVLTVDGGQMA